MRRAHYIGHNKRCETAHSAIWLDCEGIQTWNTSELCEQSLAFGWLAHRRRIKDGQWSAPQWRRFTTPSEAWQNTVSFLRAKTTTYVFCHNSSYDYCVLDAFRELPKLGFKLIRACIEAPPTICVFKHGSVKLVLLDTLNYWRVPLAKIGEVIGVPKIDFGFCYASMEAHDEYCRRDVEVIMAQCIHWWEFLQDEDMGGFAPTLASQAMRSYRHSGMKYHIFIDDDAAALSLAREAYHGGRTEPFALGDFRGSFTVLDFNSMYPSVMESECYPTVLRGVRTDITPRQIAELKDSYCYVAHVELDTDEPAYGVKTKDRLVFPVGRFEAFLTTPTLLYAIERGHLRRIIQCAAYLKAPIFRAWVKRMYALRLHYASLDNDAWVYFIKILMNSLYGKFGQRGYVYESEEQIEGTEARQWVDYNADTGELTHYRQFGGLLQVLRQEGESRESHPAIAAHVTDYGSLKLWRSILQAGQSNVYYCDTDSLIVNDDGRDSLFELTDPHALGALKAERVGTRLRIWGPKDYQLDDYERHKGVRSKATWLTENSVEQQQWTSLRGWLGNGMSGGPRIKMVQKTLRREYGRDRLRADGRLDSPRLLQG